MYCHYAFFLLNLRIDDCSITLVIVTQDRVLYTNLTSALRAACVI